MPKKPLHILIIASWYPTEDKPSQGSFIEEQARMLQNSGHSVTVLHPFLTGTFLGSLRKKKKVFYSSIYNGIKIIHVGVSPVLPGFRQLSYIKCYLKSKKALKYFDIEPKSFDFIHSHSIFMGGIIGFKLSNHLNIPLIHTEHTSGLIFNIDQYTASDQKAIKEVYKSAQKVLFVSNFSKRETLKQFAISDSDKFKVLPNCVEPMFFNSSIQPAPKKFKYLIIGNLIEVKNHELLLTAWNLVLEEYPNSQLTIVGEGKLKHKLYQQEKDLELKNVEWLDRKNRKEILQLISNHNVIVSSSRIETFGLSIAEAQASGKPVVVTDSGGVRDIVTEETGIITNQNPHDFATGLISIQKNYSQYNPEFIRDLTIKKFSSKRISEELEKVYYSL